MAKNLKMFSPFSDSVQKPCLTHHSVRVATLCHSDTSHFYVILISMVIAVTIFAKGILLHHITGIGSGEGVVVFDIHPAPHTGSSRDLFSGSRTVNMDHRQMLAKERLDEVKGHKLGNSQRFR